MHSHNIYDWAGTRPGTLFRISFYSFEQTLLSIRGTGTPVSPLVLPDVFVQYVVFCVRLAFVGILVKLEKVNITT